MKIQIMANESGSDYWFEIDDLYWFEEQGVHDFDGEGFYESYNFRIIVDGVTVYPVTPS